MAKNFAPTRTFVLVENLVSIRDSVTTCAIVLKSRSVGLLSALVVARLMLSSTRDAMKFKSSVMCLTLLRYFISRFV